MRDPLHRTPLRGELLQRALARYPRLDVSAIDAAANLEYTDKIVDAVAGVPLAAHGLSAGRFRVMMYLELEEELGHEAPSPSTIAENLGVTRATITQLIDGMERDGLAERKQGSGDRRGRVINLTQEGRRLFDEVVPLLAERVAHIFAPLDLEERRTLIRLLSKLAAQCDAMEAE